MSRQCRLKLSRPFHTHIHASMLLHCFGQHRTQGNHQPSQLDPKLSVSNSKPMPRLWKGCALQSTNTKTLCCINLIYGDPFFLFGALPNWNARKKCCTYLDRSWDHSDKMSSMLVLTLVVSSFLYSSHSLSAWWVRLSTFFCQPSTSSWTFCNETWKRRR